MTDNTPWPSWQELRQQRAARRAEDAAREQARRAAARQPGARIWKWVRTPSGDRLHDAGIFADGSLFNPRHHPEEVLRAAIVHTIEQIQAWRHRSAKQAAVTRKLRRELLITDLVKHYVANGTFTPAPHCRVCGRGLTDAESLARGIGSECWDNFLRQLTAARQLIGFEKARPSHADTL
jgi:hypothetical protein